jgi:hypothetical protein
MASKKSVRQVPVLLIMIAMSGCTTTATVEGGPGPAVPVTCSQDLNVVGCIAGATGYSCSGTDSPDDGDSALNCSAGTSSTGGLTLYCCLDASSVTAGCSADSSIMGCVGASFGFSCTGSAEPSQGDSSLVCSTGTPSGSATLFCCASYAASAGTCTQDRSVQGCTASSIGFSCTGSDTPTQVNPALVCSTGTPASGGTQYCCGSGASTMVPMTTPTATCEADLSVTCTAPATGFSCVGGAMPMQTDATLSCGSGITEADGTTQAYCCSAAAQPAPCAPDPSVTGCPGDATGYTCTGGANPMTSSLLCGAAMPGAKSAVSYCCTPG